MSKYTTRSFRRTKPERKKPLNALKRSYLDLSEPFITAKDAATAIQATPTKKGTRMRYVPHSMKLAMILKKSPDFELSHRDSKKRPVFVLAK